MARVNYSDDQRANALAILKAEGGNISRAARLAQVSRNTLVQWRDQAQPGTPIEQLSSKKATDLAALFEAEVRAAIGTLPDKRDQASYKDLVTGAAILTDKIQLLRGEPTERSEVTKVDRTPPSDDTLRAVAQSLQRRGLAN